MGHPGLDAVKPPPRGQQEEQSMTVGGVFNNNKLCALDSFYVQSDGWIKAKPQ